MSSHPIHIYEASIWLCGKHLKTDRMSKLYLPQGLFILPRSRTELLRIRDLGVGCDLSAVLHSDLPSWCFVDATLKTYICREFECIVVEKQHTMSDAQSWGCSCCSNKALRKQASLIMHCFRKVYYSRLQIPSSLPKSEVLKQTNTSENTVYISVLLWTSKTLMESDCVVI